MWRYTWRLLGEEMKEQFKLPFLVLIPFLIAIIAQGSTNIAHSIITVALCAVYGYQCFLDYKVKENERLKTEAEFAKVRDEIARVASVAAAEASRASANVLSAGGAISGKRENNILF